MTRPGLDQYDLEAMEEVDELTPATPPIHPGRVGPRIGDRPPGTCQDHRDLKPYTRSDMGKGHGS